MSINKSNIIHVTVDSCQNNVGAAGPGGTTQCASRKLKNMPCRYAAGHYGWSPPLEPTEPSSLHVKQEN